jgi:hypothetical protein
MGYIEKFKEELIKHSHAKDYDKAIKEWVFDGDISEGEPFCICGHPITKNMLVRNNLNAEQLVVGNCCIKKFNIEREHYNKSRLDYLRYAYRRTKNDKERQFLIELADRLKRKILDGNGEILYLSQRQVNWLEQISGKKYRWNTTKNFREYN